MLPKVSEFCPSPFSMNPSLYLIILKQTDWEKKKEVVLCLSVNQRGKNPFISVRLEFHIDCILVSIYLAV